MFKITKIGIAHALCGNNESQKSKPKQRLEVS